MKRIRTLDFIKRLFARSVLLLILCMSLLGVNGAPAYAEEVTLVADEWCPYNCIPDTDRPGFMVEIAQAIFEPEGIDVRYTIVPWSRAAKEVEDGVFHGAIATLPTETPGLTYPTVEQAVSTMIVLTMSGSDWTYDGIESLNGKRIGVVQDYFYGEEMDKYIAANSKNTQRVVVSTGDSPFMRNLKLLEGGRVDAIVVDQDVFRYYAYMNDVKDKYAEVGVLDTVPLFIGFSPKLLLSDKYKDMTDRGMQRLRASGKLDSILARYGLVDWR